MFRIVVRLLSIVGAVLAAFLTLLWFTQRRLMYFPSADVPPPAVVGLSNAEVVKFATDDGLMLNGWFVRGQGPIAGTVIVFNGNAGNRAYRSDLAAQFTARGLSVLLFDYRGYGENPGSPTEEGLALDARAARRYVLSRDDVEGRRLVYFGESLGSAVAVRLAVEQTPDAVILRSPFTSFVDLGRLHYPALPVGWILRDRYPSIDRIGRIGCPLLVIAGSADVVVPMSQSRRLFDAAREPKRFLIVDGADHNDEVLAAGPRLVEAAVDFLHVNH